MIEDERKDGADFEGVLIKGELVKRVDSWNFTKIISNGN